MERTLLILKPDTVQRQLIGTIVDRLERKGLKIAALRMTRVEESLARELYQEHKGKDFYEPLVEFITAGPIVVMVVEGYGGIEMVRRMMGATFGPEAEPGTIRGDFGASHRYNLIHGSDAPDTAKREIALFFSEEEIQDYKIIREPWIYASIDRNG